MPLRAGVLSSRVVEFSAHEICHRNWSLWRFYDRSQMP